MTHTHLPKTETHITIGVLLCVLALGFVSPCFGNKEIKLAAVDEVCLETGTCFSVSLAQTEASRARGLMYRTFLAPQEGMLFVFDKDGIYPFWMKDTLISLDILWLSAGKRVVHIETQTLPMSTRSLVPSAKSRYVLEVVGGTVKRLGIKVGDSLTFRSSKAP